MFARFGSVALGLLRFAVVCSVALEPEETSLDRHMLACGICSSGDDACPEGERLMAEQLELERTP